MVKRIPKVIRDRVKELTNQGKSTRQIASVMVISQSSASRIVKKKFPSQTKTPQGRPRILDNQDEKYICRLATTGRCTTATAIQKELREYAGISTSSNTIRRALKRNGIKSRSKKKRPQLTKTHRRARAEFERSHRGWKDDDWDKVIWSDETKICLHGSDGRDRVLRKDGEPIRDHHITPTRKFCGGSIMIWGCMLSSGVGFMCRIDTSVNAEVYEKILDDELMKTIE